MNTFARLEFETLHPLIPFGTPASLRTLCPRAAHMNTDMPWLFEQGHRHAGPRGLQADQPHCWGLGIIHSMNPLIRRLSRCWWAARTARGTPSSERWAAVCSEGATAQPPHAAVKTQSVVLFNALWMIVCGRGLRAGAMLVGRSGKYKARVTKRRTPIMSNARQGKL